jgi:ppGpp synthetase/RelA/SpoT-type nucleotidyltranferase
MFLNFTKKIKFVLYSLKEKISSSDIARVILEDYKMKRPIYEDFCITLQKILDAFLSDRNYKYHISCRTKTLESLEQKIIKKMQNGKVYTSLNKVEDLAGIRVIFYSEKDKNRFLKEIQGELSGIISIDNKEKENGYNATHFIVSLGSKRLKLSEYKKFNGFVAEIQVTSIFYHAWSEIEHDFIYKDKKNLKEKDPQRFENMQNKLYMVMNKHIKIASAEFEKIVEEFN